METDIAEEEECEFDVEKLNKFAIYLGEESEDGIPIGYGFKEIGQIQNACLSEYKIDNAYQNTETTYQCHINNKFNITLVRWCDGTIGALFQSLETGRILAM